MQKYQLPAHRTGRERTRKAACAWKRNPPTSTATTVRNNDAIWSRQGPVSVHCTRFGHYRRLLSQGPGRKTTFVTKLISLKQIESDTIVYSSPSKGLPLWLPLASFPLGGTKELCFREVRWNGRLHPSLSRRRNCGSDNPALRSCRFRTRFCRVIAVSHQNAANS